MREKLTRHYFRPVRAHERERIEDACRTFEQALKNLRFHRENTDATIEFHLRNKRNPNGFTITVGATGKPKVTRSLNLMWARKNGYVDTYFTSTGRAPRRRTR